MHEIIIRRPGHITDVAIQTDIDELAEQIRVYYRPFIVEEGSADPAPLHITTRGGVAAVSVWDSEYITENPFQEVVNFLYEQIRIDPALYALHAAAVEWEGQATILAGATGSGKTTLTAYLLYEGMGYVTDDCVLIDRGNRTVLPYPGDIHLRRGGADVLRKQRIVLSGEWFYHSTAERLIYVPEKPVRDALPIARILWLKRAPDGNRRRVLGPGEALRRLMQGALTAEKPSGSHLRFLSMLAALPCEAVHYADMDYVAGIIRGDGE